MVSAKNENKAIMCYFGSWSTYRWSYGHFDVEDIDPFLCTHIVYGFAGTYSITLVSILPTNRAKYAFFNPDLFWEGKSLPLSPLAAVSVER